MLWKSIICDCGGQNNLPCMDYFSVQSRLVRSGKRLSSQVARISVPLATLHNLPVWLWFWGHGREGRKSTLLKGKNWREFPSLLRSCYFARNLLWPGSAAGAIALLGNAYLNYQMNPTEARFRQWWLCFTVCIIWCKKANATSGSTTAEGWVISEKKWLVDMPSGKSAPDDWFWKLRAIPGHHPEKG